MLESQVTTQGLFLSSDQMTGDVIGLSELPTVPGLDTGTAEKLKEKEEPETKEVPVRDPGTHK